MVMPIITPFDRFIGHVAALLRGGVRCSLSTDGDSSFTFVFTHGDDFNTFLSFLSGLDSVSDPAPLQVTIAGMTVVCAWSI